MTGLNKDWSEAGLLSSAHNFCLHRYRQNKVSSVFLVFTGCDQIWGGGARDMLSSVSAEKLNTGLLSVSAISDDLQYLHE